MSFWYEVLCQFVTIDYGRYEAVRCVDGHYTWTPVLAGPREPDVLASLSDFDYAQAITPV